MISLRNIHKSFGPQKVLDGLDLDIPDGKITAIIGPSGEGKSVLLKHLIGLLQPDSGAVEVDGESIVDLRRSELNRIREKFGMLFQNVALFDSMTVFENVAFPLEEKTSFSKAVIREKVLTALEDVGLKNIENKFPDELSGGMKKRVGLARAVVLNPKIILFDEPTTGLDPIGVYNICNLIQRLQAEGKTTLMVTHDLLTAFATSQRFTFLHQARMLFEGNEVEMRASTIPEVREFLEPTAGSLFV
jgi:phospholipid/cholesterol/gamma-HCH transport system ATP-binding protein